MCMADSHGCEHESHDKEHWSGAENYKGPSLVIAYSPCINHGIKTGIEQVLQKKRKQSNAVTGTCTAIIRF